MVFIVKFLESSHLFLCCSVRPSKRYLGSLSGMEDIQPPVRQATNPSQLGSLAELPKRKKYAIFETLTEDHCEPYHDVSCFPITVKAEDDMVCSS
jgi:hypothetical protein